MIGPMPEIALPPSEAPRLPDAKMHLVRPTEPVPARIVGSTICQRGKSASFVRHVEIDVSGTPIAGNFLSGQSFGILAPGQDETGREHKVRLYSIASPSWGEDGEGRILATTPKRLIDERRRQREGDDPDDHRLFLGVCSNYLCDLRVGDTVLVAGPNGKSFLLPQDPSQHDFVFFATGTGIAPFRGFLIELLRHPRGSLRRDIHLCMGSPYVNDLLYDDLLRGLAQEHPNFHYHTAISREAPPGARRGPYVHELLDAPGAAPLRQTLERSSTLVYVCGLAGMQVELFRNFARHGLGAHYLAIKDDEVRKADATQWTQEQIKRFVRPSKRCMIEVY